MAYTPQHIANFFLSKADAESSPMTQLKLIKLVYIAYGWYLALKSEKLFNEAIEAWQHGPVIPSVYHEFKDFGKLPISRKSMNLDLDTWQISTPELPSDDNDTGMILTAVWNVYKGLDGWRLRQMTHEDGTPWKKVYVEGERGIKINDEDVKEHYQVKIRGYLESAKSKQ
jgi:uncharacterized phage-associated protein